MLQLPEAGQRIELHYPTRTHVNEIDQSPQRLRRFEVLRIRDLVQQPLMPHEFLQRPYVARSRWLYRVADLDFPNQPFRQIYLGSAAEYQSPGTLRLAIYDGETSQPERWIGRQFEANAKDRKAMIRMLRKIVDKDYAPNVRVVATDLRRLG